RAAQETPPSDVRERRRDSGLQMHDGVTFARNDVAAGTIHRVDVHGGLPNHLLGGVDDVGVVAGEVAVGLLVDLDHERVGDGGFDGNVHCFLSAPAPVPGAWC